MEKIASWGRKFQVWQYSVSHSVLLLRSFHPQNYGTRVDVAFSDVALMRLQSSYDTLVIHRATEEERREILGKEAGLITHGCLFLLNEGTGYVQAARCVWHEDEGDHRSPSKFGPLRGTQ